MDKMSTNNQQTDLITTFDNCNTRTKVPNTFFVLSNSPDKPQNILTKEGYDFVQSEAKDLLTKVYTQFLWETGARAKEAEAFSLSNLNGNKITIKNLKSRGKKPMKTMLISDDLIVQLVTLDRTLISDRTRFFVKVSNTWNKVLKGFKSGLTNKMFRSGLATYMLNMGATKEDIQARLGHGDLRSLPYYTKERSAESDAFMNKVFSGVDTRTMMSLSVDEYNQNLREQMSIILANK